MNLSPPTLPRREPVFGREDIRPSPREGEEEAASPKVAAAEVGRQLRQLLSEKFPGLSLGLKPAARDTDRFWYPELSSIRADWPTRLAKGALTEIVGAGPHSGSASLMHALLHGAAAENHLAGVIDGMDSLDVTSLSGRMLSRLLWARCRSVAEALKAADLMLRDSNFSFVLLDLKLSPTGELRKIPATTWYRLYRLVERTSTACLVFTPCQLVGATRQRFFLRATETLANRA